MKNTIFKAICNRQPCEKCRAESIFLLHRQEKSGGGFHLLWICTRCDSPFRASNGAGLWEKKSTMESAGLDYDDLPIYKPY